MLLLVADGILDSIGWVMFETALRRSADPSLLGRAFGVTDATVRTATIGSIALAPSVNELVAPDAILRVGAAVLAIAGLVALAGAYSAVTGSRTAAQSA